MPKNRSLRRRLDYVYIVTKRYFDGVDNKRLDHVLDCFHSDAVLHEMTSDTKHDGIAAIRTMFEGLFDTNGRIWHGNFVHTADPDSNSVCSQFTVEIEPKELGEELVYQNCNRFISEGRQVSDCVRLYERRQSAEIEGVGRCNIRARSIAKA